MSTVEPYDCPRCGQLHVGCRGHVDRCRSCQARVTVAMAGVCADCGSSDVEKDTPCRRAPMVGGFTCRSHGGSAVQVVSAAAERRATVEQEKAVIEFGARRDIAPGPALNGALAISQGHVEYYLKVAVEALAAGDGPAHRVAMAHHGTNLDRVVNISATMLKLGLEAQQLAFKESEISEIASVMKATFDDPMVGLSHRDRTALRQSLGRHLKGLSTIDAASTDVGEVS